MLEHVFERWKRFEGTSAEVTPNINPLPCTGSYPRLCSQAGYHMADRACPISADIWSSALWSAWSAVEAAESRAFRQTRSLRAVACRLCDALSANLTSFLTGFGNNHRV